MPKIYKFKNLNSAQATITELAKSLQTDDIILYTDNNSRSIGTTYWTRSTYKMVHMWCIVDTQGYAYYSGGGNQMTIVFTFSI